MVDEQIFTADLIFKIAKAKLHRNKIQKQTEDAPEEALKSQEEVVRKLFVLMSLVTSLISLYLVAST